MLGTVSFYNRKRGWGFVLPDDTSQCDAFLHVNNLPQNHRFLNEGDRISYDPGEIRKGRPQARNIKIIEEANPSTAVRP